MVNWIHDLYTAPTVISVRRRFPSNDQTETVPLSPPTASMGSPYP
jgi:hypothetical protein